MLTQIEPALRAKLDALFAEARTIFDDFERTVRQKAFHPFKPADNEAVLQTLLAYRSERLRFLEWGSALGVITITADLLGMEAYGIEIDAGLVATARELAAKYDSNARFAAGSFLPDGYTWRSESGDPRLGTIGVAPAGYTELGHELHDFDLVYVYPWTGEDPIVHDVMRRRGRPGARLLVNTGSQGIKVFTNPTPQPNRQR